jgi:hypothetical protein
MRISRTGSAFGVTTLFALAATFAPFELPHGWKPVVGPILWMGSLFFGFCLLSHHVGWMGEVRQKAAKKDVIILSAIFLLSGVVGTSLFLIFQFQSDRRNQVAESSTAQKLPPSERPFITISPIKDKQDHYINIIESPDSVTVEITFEIKNSGTVETEAFVLAGDAVNINPSTGETQIIRKSLPAGSPSLQEENLAPKPGLFTRNKQQNRGRLFCPN